ncbi:MAG TPA: ferritin-like domain-containing protein [Sandaracinaceae bacterium LLY-WYZ-13_1]|nr:ferritin-like domain-containing protein [Sandaracinaceae bacterium LLY-WYZ-13_1]
MAKERRLGHATGVFEAMSRERLGPPVDLSGLDLARHPAERVELARRVWQSRVRTEFRSVQIMTRFLTEVVGAGDPFEVYAAALDLVEDEVRHVGLTAQLCEALGAPALLPDPVELRDPPRYLKAPMAERALTTAIQMLAINETISVAFIEDLHARCDDPAVARVLGATVADEEGHQDLGWAYVSQSLARFPDETLRDWRHLVETTLEPHRAQAERILREVPEAERRLDAHPEPELAALGLFSPVRQALVFERVWETSLEPRLRERALL